MAIGQMLSRSSAATAPLTETQEMLKTAVAAGVITLLLSSLIVGIETVSSTGQLDFTTRFKEVFIAGDVVLTPRVKFREFFPARRGGVLHDDCRASNAELFFPIQPRSTLNAGAARRRDADPDPVIFP